MYLTRTPKIGDKIEVTHPELSVVRATAGLLNRGIVTQVDATTGPPRITFAHGDRVDAISSVFCSVLDRSVQDLQIKR